MSSSDMKAIHRRYWDDQINRKVKDRLVSGVRDGSGGKLDKIQKES